MQSFARRNIGLRHNMVAAFAVCGLIIAASAGLAVRAQAEDARADYVAPLDMTSTYADPLYTQKTLSRAASAAQDTTGLNRASSGSGHKDMAASQQDLKNEINAAFPDDIYKFAP
jgi:hypothetical protein